MGKSIDQIEAHEMWHADEHDDGEIYVYDDKLHMDVCIATEMPPEHRDRAVACVNALIGVPNPEGIRELIRDMKLMTAGDLKGEVVVTCLRIALRRCGILGG